MSFHIFLKRCDECWYIYQIRRPKTDTTFVRVIQRARCPYCHPEDLDQACISCRLPYDIVGHHADGMCQTCYISLYRYKKQQRDSMPA